MNKKMIKIAIVEDQIENVEVLKYFLNQYSKDIVIKYIAQNGQEARKVLVNKDIDLALLDIDLGDETIFDVLNSIDYSHLNNSLIFVTAHGSFENAIRAIRFSCLNFITKPIDFDELESTLDKAFERTRQENGLSIETLLDIFKTDVISPKKIGIPLSHGEVQYEDCDNIIYILADDSVSHVQLHDDINLNSVKNLGYFSKLFVGHKDFHLIHKSTLINLNHIKKFNHRERLITMSDNKQLEVSRRKLISLQNAIKAV